MSIFQYIDLFFRKSLIPFNNLRMKNNPDEKFLIEELRKNTKAMECY